jgi:hypothetical protein
MGWWSHRLLGWAIHDVCAERPNQRLLHGICIRICWSLGKLAKHQDPSVRITHLKLQANLLMISCRGNSTIAQVLLAPPPLSIAQKFKALPQGTKLAIYSGSGAAGALLASALLFTCIRQRRVGRRERDAYNARIEKDREDAYRDQMEMREKGLGGWDDGAYATQGEDALGGWGGTHVVPQDRKDVLPKFPGNAVVNEGPSRVNSPAISSRVNSPAPRLQTPQLVSPQPQSARVWNGGAYSGGYGGSSNCPRSPGFPPSPQVPQQRGYTGGYATGGYQRF